ncbi:MAG: type II methionyl aminopeptidase [Nanoarchaeota archaeon]|nr:type II methionyl aminopeptidase [Nanoarchaeota archaeon]
MSHLNIEILEKLGKLTRELRKEVSPLAKTGVDITEIIDFIEKKIFSQNYLPSFPAMVSVNDMAAHYTVFDEGYILKKGDVIKIDFGISESGFITDNAFTVEIDDNKHEKLISTAKACLDAAMETANFGTSMSQIGKSVYDVAKKNGFNTIHNLSGHQIEQYNLHAGFGVPNYDNNDSNKIKNGMQFAIEPFVTYGEPKIKSCRLSNIVHLVNDKPIRDPIAKKVLSYIKEKYPKLPFSKRWLVKGIIQDLNPNANSDDGFEKRKVLYALKILKRYNIIYEYDELGTIDGEIVAQFEDCVVFSQNKKSIITRLK